MERDCKEGCDDDHTHKWEIIPHPYDSDFDVLVTDDDDEALRAIQEAAEKAWDACEPGQTQTITIKHNALRT